MWTAAAPGCHRCPSRRSSVRPMHAPSEPAPAPTSPPRRLRWRALLKWSGTLACLLILLAAAACLRWRYVAINVGRNSLVSIQEGSVWVGWGGSGWLGHSMPRAVQVGPPYANLGAAADNWSKRGILWPQWRDLRPWGIGVDIRVPLWIPVVLLGAPTAWLWWRDRRRVPAGCCAACGYDLTGNVSGRCPECGALCEVGTPKSEV